MSFFYISPSVRKRDGLPVAVKVIDLEESNDDIQTINKEITTLVGGKSCPQLINYFGSVVCGTKLWISNTNYSYRYIRFFYLFIL